MALTNRQEGFCQDVVGRGNSHGMTLTDAYKQNYSTAKSKPSLIHQLASRLAGDVKIQSRIEDLKQRKDRAATVVGLSNYLSGCLLKR